MPNFEYIAKDAAGLAQTGVVAAESESAAARALGEKSLFPVRVALQTARQSRGGSFSFGLAVKPRQLAVVYSQLSDLLTAGVPILRSLEILCRAVTNSSLKTVLDQVRQDVSAGQTLADSMAKHPKVFTSLHVAMVRAGEHAGFLESVLMNLAGFLERQDELRSKVRGAMIYPILLASFGAIVVTLMLVFLVPQFKSFFHGVSLPLPTQILFIASDALTGQAWVVLVALALAVAGLRQYLRSQRGHKLWAKWQLKIPVAGNAIRMVAVTRFCRILGTMLGNGVPIIQALGISKDAAGNEIIAKAIDASTESVRAGEPLAKPLSDCGLFPAEIIEMISVGEESNQLEKVLVQTADAVERRTNRQVDAAVRLIEPLMLIFMAGMVALIAVGLLYPILTMSKAIGK
jgi:general secretion pathway protein F/type IV pilus assembly protein PilC